MRFTWGAFYLFLFVYRSVYSVLAEVVVARLTPLGDSTSYQVARIPILSASILDPDLLIGRPRFLATQITISIGGVFRAIFGSNAILIDLGFQTIGFVGIVILLRAVEPRLRIWLAAFLMMPSFTIWSSVAGKEAIVVLAVGILAAYIIKFFRGEARFRAPQALALVIVFLFKAQYLPAVLYILGATFLSSFVRQKTFLVTFLGFTSMVPLYLFRDKISALSFQIAPNFSSGSRSTREPFWLEKYDVFLKSPEGIFRSFFGPMFSETGTSILLLASFMESSVILTVLIAIAIRKFPDLPVYMVALVGFTLFWLLFATYPLGVMNPGSAIRYRTGYEILIIVSILFLLSRATYGNWLDRKRSPGEGEGGAALPKA